MYGAEHCESYDWIDLNCPKLCGHCGKGESTIFQFLNFLIIIVFYEGAFISVIQSIFLCISRSPLLSKEGYVSREKKLVNDELQLGDKQILLSGTILRETFCQLVIQVVR